MVNFYSDFVSPEDQNATIDTVIEHLNHIKNIIGSQYIGIGADYDGVSKLVEIFFM